MTGRCRRLDGYLPAMVSTGTRPTGNLQVPALALHADLSPQRGDLQLVLLHGPAEVLSRHSSSCSEAFFCRLLQQQHLLLSPAQLQRPLLLQALRLLLDAAQLIWTTATNTLNTKLEHMCEARGV